MLPETFVQMANETHRSIRIWGEEYKTNWKINGPDGDLVSLTIDKYHIKASADAIIKKLAEWLGLEPHLISLNRTFDSCGVAKGLEFSISSDSIEKLPFPLKDRTQQPLHAKSNSSEWMTLFLVLLH